MTRRKRNDDRAAFIQVRCGYKDWNRGKPLWIQRLTNIGACYEAVQWAMKQPNLQTAWEKCTRTDWMYWLLHKEADEAMTWKSIFDQGNPRKLNILEWVNNEFGKSVRVRMYTGGGTEPASLWSNTLEYDLASRKRMADWLRFYFPNPRFKKLPAA